MPLDQLLLRAFHCTIKMKSKVHSTFIINTLRKTIVFDYLWKKNSDVAQTSGSFFRVRFYTFSLILKTLYKTAN